MNEDDRYDNPVTKEEVDRYLKDGGFSIGPPLGAKKGPCPFCGRTDAHSHTSGPWGVT